jgi:uncharacterized membrane protein YhaH (DUF805 family)
MIESFWKKYWFEMLVSIGFFVGAVIFLFTGKEFAAIIYFVSSFVWLICTLVGYNNMRIEALAKRIADLEAELYKDKK